MFVKRRNESFSNKRLIHVAVLLKILFRSIFFFDLTLNRVNVIIFNVTIEICAYNVFNNEICKKISSSFLNEFFLILKT